jgi:hypothetical protein
MWALGALLPYLPNWCCQPLICALALGIIRRMGGCPSLANGTIAARKYRVLDYLRHEGPFEVYRVQDVGTGQSVLLKYLASCEQDSDIVARSMPEIRMCCIIDSPYVARTFAVEHEAQTLCVVMEQPPGEPLCDLLERESTLAVNDAAEIARQCLCALQAAHKLLIHHRDLKPANVFVARTGQRVDVKVTDFGLAGFRGGETQASGPGVFRGTPGYAAPEQVFLWPDTDASSDLFSLGAMLFEMLTGLMPYGDNWREACINALESRLAPHPTQPAGLWKIVTRAILLVPSQRYQSGREMRVAIEEYLNHRPSFMPKKRTRMIPIGTAIGVLVGAVLAWTTVKTARHLRQEETGRLRAAIAKSQDRDPEIVVLPALAPATASAAESIGGQLAPAPAAEVVAPALTRAETFGARSEPVMLAKVASPASTKKVARGTSRHESPQLTTMLKPVVARVEPPKSAVAQVASPTITVGVSVQAAELDDLKILLDGIAQHRATWGVALPTQLGIHQLRASAAGRKAWATTVRVNAARPHATVNIPVLQALVESAPSTQGDEPSPNDVL